MGKFLLVPKHYGLLMYLLGFQILGLVYISVITLSASHITRVTRARAVVAMTTEKIVYKKKVPAASSVITVEIIPRSCRVI
jgi:hypothetical protein